MKNNLRDNEDGTCNCRPIDEKTCFFQEFDGSRCNCKCHRERGTVPIHQSDNNKGETEYLNIKDMKPAWYNGNKPRELEKCTKCGKGIFAPMVNVENGEKVEGICATCFWTEVRKNNSHPTPPVQPVEKECEAWKR